ncbi:hypothetical protein BDW62DRAFT_206843 [Aspergillus aurantiobrunneus]
MTQAQAARSLTLGPQCWSCRARRVRCGSEAPECTKCAEKGIACPGYRPTRPLRWKEPQHPRGFEQKQRAETYWKFIFWPLTIAGVYSVVGKRNRSDVEYILYEMTAELGTLCMRDAAVFLQRLWEDSAGGRVQDGWDEIFRDAPLFLL